MSSSPRLSDVRVLLGVSGSIAAYKAVELLRALIAEGAAVHVVMTQAATRFVSPLTFEVLSRNPVATDLFAARQEMLHLTLPEQSSIMVIAPASANQVAKYAAGLADDLLSTMVLTAPCPLIIAPAMDGGMWDHPAVQGNIETLRQRGVWILDPEEGPLASGRIGKGRLVPKERVLAAIGAILGRRRDWQGERVLISAGPTQEPLDAVRFISNRSSGKMGYALAEAARQRGADVVLVTGPTTRMPPAGVELVPVTTAESMAKALYSRFPWCTTLIMAAAVADFRPKHASQKKMKKKDAAWQRLELEATEDILETLARRRTMQCLVGFAAETENVIEHARTKLERKGLDLIVGNNVAEEGSGFGSDTSAAVLIDRQGQVTHIPTMPKRALADRILDALKGLADRSFRPSTP